MTIFLAVVGLIVLLVLLVCAAVFWFLNLVIKKRDHFIGSIQRPTLSVDFVATSAAVFRIPYKLTWRVERHNPIKFLAKWMFLKEIETAFAHEYNSGFFLPSLERDSIQLRVGSNEEATEWRPEQSYAKLLKCEDVGEQHRYHELSPNQLIEQIERSPLDMFGCHFRLCGFEFREFTDELIEENYAMLNEADKEKVENDTLFHEYEEKLAVALLKRRLDSFRDKSKQLHDGGPVSIGTERAAHGLKINWTFQPSAPSGYDLLGFRKTGSFFPDKWDEQNNGPLVIEGRQSGWTIDPLKEGETYFYTFILKPWPDTPKPLRYSIARFQVTMATGEETEAVESMIRRIEQRSAPDPARQNISQLVRDFGLVFEFHNAVDAMEKALIADIKNKNLPKKEEAEKIAFVRDTIRLQRERYEP